MHLYTPLVLTLVVAPRLYDNGLTEVRERHGVLAVTVACVGIVGANLWEIAEWTFDLVVRGDVILGKTGTIIDPISGIVGAAVAGGVIVCLTRD